MIGKVKSGFTLIELLVVIAIIAILAAILFPVFAQAREKARQTVCLSNMKQISTGMIMYTSDYDGYWPRSEGCSATPLTNPAAPQPWECFGGTTFALRLNQYKWQGWIMPYVKNVDIFFCPSRADKAKSADLWKKSGEINNGYALSTPITGYINSGKFDAHSFLGRGMTGALQTPAETFIIMEGPYPTTSSIYPAGGATQQTGTGETIETIYPAAYYESWNDVLYPTVKGTSSKSLDRNIAPHSEGMIFAFCDGHAKWYSAKTFLSKCPTASDYGATNYPKGINMMSGSGSPGTFNEGDVVPIKSNWPLWGLVKNQ